MAIQPPTVHENTRRAILMRRVTSALVYLALLAFSFVILFPFYWVLRTALTDPALIYGNIRSLLPTEPTTINLLRVIGLYDPTELIASGATNITAGNINFLLFVRNSLIVGVTITVFQVFFSATAAYAFARLKFPGRDTLFAVYIAGLLIPGIVLFIPNYVLVRELGWLNTFLGVMAPTLLMTPFAVFFMRQFFLGLNVSIEEAAILDGASKIGYFTRIALPLIQGPALTLAVLTFILSWNQYLWPFVVGREENVRMLTVALSVFQSQTPQGAPDWTGLMSAAAISIIPSMLLFAFLGRRVVDSIQFSGFK